MIFDLEGARRREVQAIGAAISTRSWHDAETAYNALRDKMDAVLHQPAPPAALSPQALPAPGEVENLDPGSARYEAARALLVADLLRIAPDAYRQMAEDLKAGNLMFLPSWISMQAIGRLLTTPAPTLATVAAANDEGVAIDAALSAMSWSDERMIADARKIAAGVWFETYGYGGDCCLTAPQVTSFRSCLDSARAAIRLLSQGEGA